VVNNSFLCGCAVPANTGLQGLALIALLCVLSWPSSGLAADSRREAAADKSSIALAWRPDPDATNFWVVEVRGLKRQTLRRLPDSDRKESEWNKVLSVVAEQGDLTADIGLPPMLGRYWVKGGSAWFRPRFPLQAGVTYRAALRLRELPESSFTYTLSSTFRLPDRVPVSTTVVSQIYPTAAVVPENLLKFYLEFSAPMSGGHIYDHIRLVDDAGRAVELPFLEIDEELWDPSMTRLTLFIDPGRIKRGVTPLEEVGPALQDGHDYALIIDEAWLDAQGAPLKGSFRKSFRVGSPNRLPIDPGQWKIQTPGARSRQALVVRFDRAMDWALARRVIEVRRGRGQPVAGLATLHDQEREWHFLPDTAWAPGTCELVIAATLEDLAGNNIGKAFEVDLFEKVQRRVTNAVSRLSFEVR